MVYWVFTGFLLGFTGFYLVWMGLTGFYPHFIGFERFFPSFTWSYWVLPGLTRFYLVFTGFSAVCRLVCHNKTKNNRHDPWSVFPLRNETKTQKKRNQNEISKRKKCRAATAKLPPPTNRRRPITVDIYIDLSMYPCGRNCAAEEHPVAFTGAGRRPAGPVE